MKRREFLRLLGLTSVSPMLLMGKGKAATKALEIVMPNGYEYICMNCYHAKKGVIYYPFRGKNMSFSCFVCKGKLTYIKNNTALDQEVVQKKLIPEQVPQIDWELYRKQQRVLTNAKSQFKARLEKYLIDNSIKLKE